MTDLTRRDALKAAGGAALVTALPAAPGWARRRGPHLLRRGEFPSGVIAGEPKRRGALLWTQLGVDDAPGRLRLEIAADEEFRRIVHSETVCAAPSSDRRVLTRVHSKRFKPGEEYFYRFETRTTSSDAGRFVTLRPPDSSEPIRIGFCSCQDWGTGYYTAHAGLASERCDVIVGLGDYIYETNTDGNVPDRIDDSSAGDAGECEFVGEYRAKYRIYRSDADLRAMHASAPFVMTWDDHEVEDNHAGEHGGKTADAPVDRRIPYEKRRRNAYRAFFEAMPIRRFGHSKRIYHRVRLGGMAELIVLDLRQYRSNQTCGDVPGVPCTDDGGPNHTLLGRPQMEWLKRTLSGTGARWKVLGSSIELMSWDSAPGVPLNRDGWDGYPRDRTEIGEHVLAGGIDGVAVVSGDVHHFAAGTVTTTGRITGKPWATEFVGGSITSSALDGPLGQAAANSKQTNPHQVFQNFVRRGYGVMDISPEQMRVRYRSPQSITTRPSPVETLAEFTVAHGSHDVETA